MLPALSSCYENAGGCLHWTTGQISCKVAKIHNCRYITFISLWPLVYLAQVQHGEQLCSKSEGELAR